MDINDLTIGQAQQLASIFGAQKSDDSAWMIGKNYLIRTVTMIDTGRLVGVTSQELILEDAAWIPDTGRFADAVKSCAFGEVEPFPSGRVILGRGSIIDAICIDELPRKQK
jgi:hypothetical protein